jgi:hypothetical protein
MVCKLLCLILDESFAGCDEATSSGDRFFADRFSNPGGVSVSGKPLVLYRKCCGGRNWRKRETGWTAAVSIEGLEGSRWCGGLGLGRLNGVGGWGSQGWGLAGCSGAVDEKRRARLPHREGALRECSDSLKKGWSG